MSVDSGYGLDGVDDLARDQLLGVGTQANPHFLEAFILDAIGSGNCGDVFRAKWKSTGEMVALKLIAIKP